MELNSLSKILEFICMTTSSIHKRRENNDAAQVFHLGKYTAKTSRTLQTGVLIPHAPLEAQASFLLKTVG